MGIGIGCGVGWGPGFGPEAIGFVGAGCGAGFSVGITFVGFGIGLPANYVYTLPYKGILPFIFFFLHDAMHQMQCLKKLLSDECKWNFKQMNLLIFIR